MNLYCKIIRPTSIAVAVLVVVSFTNHRAIAAFIVEGADADVAFQKALASGEKTIVIPKGNYEIHKTLLIPSGITLKADSETVITLADGAAKTSDDYLLSNANHKEGNVAITIEGGVWNGNNRGNPRPNGLFDQGYTGGMFHFQNVRGLTLKNMTLTNAEAYYMRFTHVHEFHIEEIRFDSDRIRKNNDGVHIGGNCSHGTIRNIRGLRAGVTGDDLVALNADDVLERTEVRGMSAGPISDLEIEDLQAENCHTFVRMLSVWSPISNIRIRKVRGTCRVSAINADAARGCRVPLFDEKKPPFPDGVGLLENIDAADFQVAKSQPSGTALLSLESRMKHFRLTQFKRMTDVDKGPQAPTLKLNYVAPREILIDGQIHPLNSNSLTFPGSAIETLSID
jgi:Glycosyl hydrolases family 28